MNESLIDTDTLSEINRLRSRAILGRARDYRAEWGRFTFSAITHMEIVRGYYQTSSLRRLQDFLVGASRENVIPFTTSTAELAGKIDAELLRNGIPIGRSDAMIAATAIEHGLVLVTGNTKHYERIQQIGFPLQLANWRESDS